ncbi:NAD(P)/FAD-dependent oxidoreductase [Streptomyces sp. MZ04]|uniref:FAD/NAD(P)-dependent oxidoreductase n=1 Tax=Streptomyces sp. MZ04 TaxID=2559236 RepID=UPI00107EA7F8|nr:NAD(P)/FAD-dependent oxidoreductase [Streptomyces sp. MZ04]TGA84049.1 FAD-dependent oxidoreductase [Streptomyces sp. MZ04]
MTLAVIGAGPAGLAAAIAAADRGIRVRLVDSAAQPGGQFYRQPPEALGARRPEALHHQWRTWRRLRDALARHVEAGRIAHLTEHHVWFAERQLGPSSGFTVHALLGPEQEEAATVRADAVLLATGGYEKVLPFPGWTLPGVVTAGGAQAMLKGGLVLPGRTAVVAGTGPLLMPVAVSLADAGADVAALVESAGPKDFARHAATLAAHPAKLAEGAGYAAELLRHHVELLPHHTVVEAHGKDRLDAVTVAALDPEGRVRAGTERRIPCDTLAVGHGMLPHTDLAEALGCRIVGPGVAVDAEQRTDVPGVWAAGETTGIGGAALSLAEGHIAGRSAAARLRGREPDPRWWAAAAKSRTRARQFAATVDAVYAPPAHWAELLRDDTLVCRCEEVPASAVREAVDELGATDARSVKLLTRAGMGWCQGRMCAAAVAGLTGCEERSARRPFARPVPLGVLARAGEDEPDPGRPR